MEVSGQIHAPAALHPGKEPFVAGWAGLDTVMKREIPSLYRDSNPLLIQAVVKRYTTELSRLLSSSHLTLNNMCSW
jgi:hypothetical protein